MLPVVMKVQIIKLATAYTPKAGLNLSLGFLRETPCPLCPPWFKIWVLLFIKQSAGSTHHGQTHRHASIHPGC